MRHAVSAPRCFDHGLKRAVQGWVVGFAVGPGAPEDAQPGVVEYADGVEVVAAAASRVGVDGVPGRPKGEYPKAEPEGFLVRPPLGRPEEGSLPLGGTARSAWGSA